MSDPDKGGEYAWRQDWGEQLVGVTEPTIYALEAGGLLRMPAVDGWCFGDGVWAPDGSGIVCVGYATTPRLGLVYCKNRKSALFYVPYQSPVVDAAGKVATAAAWGEPARLTREYAARSPRFSPSGNVLVYLALDECVTHNTTHKLATLAWSDAVANAGNGLVTGFVVIDTVDTPANAGAFPGLYPGELPKVRVMRVCIEGCGWVCIDGAYGRTGAGMNRCLCERDVFKPTLCHAGNFVSFRRHDYTQHTTIHNNTQQYTHSGASCRRRKW